MRTIASHGVAELPPDELSIEERTLVTTLPVGAVARTVRITSVRRKLRLEVVAGTVGKRAHDALAETVARMFRLGEDLSGFYTLVGDDAALAWSAQGAGRMPRAPTVFAGRGQDGVNVHTIFDAMVNAAGPGWATTATAAVRPSRRSEGRPKAAL
jgi:3-methyladenine DNA glycosylase/8-oxoguanine DNA glycosylase